MPPVATVDASVAPTVKIVDIPIDSKPSGATIYDEGREIGTTPTVYKAPLGNDKISLVAELDGYDDTPFTVNPLVDKERKANDPVVVRLTKPKKGPPKKIIHVHHGGGPGSGSGATTGSGGGSHEPNGGGDLSGNPYKRGGH